MNYIESFFVNNLNIDSVAARYTLMALFIVSIAFAVLRIFVTLFYKAQWSLFKISAKEFKKKEDIKPSKSSLLNKVVDDFKNLGEKGIGTINTESIATRHISGLNMLVFNIKTLSELIKAYELAVVFIGLIFAMIFDYPDVFGVSAIIIFIVLKIISVLFNFDLARDHLIYDISKYVNEEIGQFYIGDFASSIQMFKLETVVAISNQSRVISEAIEKMGESLTKSISKSMAEIGDTVTLTMESLSSFSSVLDQPVEKWKEAIALASESQQSFSKTLSDMAVFISNFEEASKELSSAILVYSKENKETEKNISLQLESLINASNNLFNQYNHIKELSEAIAGQNYYLEENQKILKSSLNSYEEIMKNMTVNMGEAFGSIIGSHVEKAYYNLNDDLKNNIKSISLSNLEVMENMDTFLEKITEQSKAQMQAIHIIRDEITKNYK